VRGQQRVIEIPLANREFKTWPPDGNARLELIEPDVHPLFMQLTQRRIEPTAFYEGTNVLKLEAGVKQEPAIWAARVGVDSELEHSEERLLAVLKLMSQDALSFGLIEGDRKEATQAAGVAQASRNQFASVGQHRA
jgi:hypothetical protein